MKRQSITADDLAAAAAASNGHLKGFQQYHTPPEWATALAAGLPYHRHYHTDLFAGSGSLLNGVSNETTRDTFALELDPDAPAFIAAALLHLPPKGQQTVRYYGLYSNKSRGQISPIPDRIVRLPKPEPPP